MNESIISIATLFSYAQLFTMFLIIVCGSLGIVLVCLMLGSEAIRRIVTHLEGYQTLVDFFWHRKAFKIWLKQKKGGDINGSI